MPIPHRRRPRAFTLIELLVVIGIIALLIGITVGVVARVRRAAYGASTSAQLATIASAIQQYYGEFHAYPGPLANVQLGAAYQVVGAAPVTMPDPNGGAPLPLQYYDPVAKTVGNFPGTSQTEHITGSENLVLGLLGGLQLQTPTGGGAVQFVYNPAAIFSDVPNDQTPSAQGALSLNYSKPGRTPAYLQVRAGDISHPNQLSNNGQFTDQANRYAGDSIIPEFVDQFSQQMPILYLRANAGGTAIASVGGEATLLAGQQMQDASGNNVVAQYDIAQIYDYLVVPKTSSQKSAIGTDQSSAARKFHGLQGLGSNNLSDPIIDPATKAPYNGGLNALAYFKDPNNPGTSNIPSVGPPPTSGNARQKDGYILISAGPDGIYGTADDIIYPGSLQP
jgi:prepilin-type N-terminal cleavage/methylation domain-containing protein